MNKLRQTVQELAQQAWNELDEAVGHDWDRPLDKELTLLQRVYDGGLGAGRNVQDVEDAVRRITTFFRLVTGNHRSNFDQEFWETYAGKLLSAAYVWLYGDAMADLRDDYTLEDILNADGDLINLTAAFMILADIPHRSDLTQPEIVRLQVRINNMLYPRGGKEPLLTAYHTHRGQYRARVLRSEVLRLKGTIKFERHKQQP